MRNTSVNILLVEDNPEDVRLTVEALKEAKVRNTLHVVRDGVEAMEFLRKAGDFSDSPCPDLVLLNLNLPGKDGYEVLGEIKSDENLKHIPVVILTASKAEEDVVKSYDLHANCYIAKPVDHNRFIRVIHSIEGFWLSIVRLPPNNCGS